MKMFVRLGRKLLNIFFRKTKKHFSTNKRILFIGFLPAMHCNIQSCIFIIVYIYSKISNQKYGAFSNCSNKTFMKQKYRYL